MHELIGYNFGALPPLPTGYRVVWMDGHYMGLDPEGNEVTAITVNPYHARQWTIAAARAETKERG